LNFSQRKERKKSECASKRFHNQKKEEEEAVGGNLRERVGDRVPSKSFLVSIELALSHLCPIHKSPCCCLKRKGEIVEVNFFGGRG
jgi:hypothetical protein